jgi:hypothetical protein
LPKRLEIPFDKSVLINIVNVIGLKKQNKDQIGNQEDGGPYYGPAHGTFFIAQVHKIPGNVISFYQGKDYKDPVERLHSQNVGVGEYAGFIDTQNHLYGGHYGQEYKNAPDFLGVGLKL